MANKKYDIPENDVVFSQSAASETIRHSSWKTMPISDKVKKMSLRKSELSTDNRTVKQMLEESLQKENNQKQSIVRLTHALALLS